MELHDLVNNNFLVLLQTLAFSICEESLHMQRKESRDWKWEYRKFVEFMGQKNPRKMSMPGDPQGFDSIFFSLYLTHLSLPTGALPCQSFTVFVFFFFTNVKVRWPYMINILVIHSSSFGIFQSVLLLCPRVSLPTFQA